jgi:sarcosine/dimethylglycine N-methyltransferase
MTERSAAVVATTEEYYDSEDADRFYERVWGGEDIHIGLYDGPSTETIAAASRKTVQTMADLLAPLRPTTRVLDLGSGYGGSARYLAENFGCHVTCLNLSERQNERNSLLCAEAGLEKLVEVRHGSFEDLPFPDQSFDVVWSQDAFLHSGRRRRVIEEASRVLDHDGRLIFTDPMQANDCPRGGLNAVYERIHLESMGSFAFYREVALDLGLLELACVDSTPHLRTHYARVRSELERQRPGLRGAVSDAYIERMLSGLTSWVDAADEGWLRWGILQFHRP